ncbi:MAG TPA: hypothetical protein GX707_15925 [Epulopiscium sp.]|nr:hypothetical protein [Candidatus Epulonipiscium sp.]
MNNNKVKCPKCNDTKYSLINTGSVSGEKLELRQCGKCYIRYRVKIISGFEALI